MVSDSGPGPALGATSGQSLPIRRKVMSCPCQEGPCLMPTRQMRRGRHSTLAPCQEQWPAWERHQSSPQQPHGHKLCSALAVSTMLWAPQRNSGILEAILERQPQAGDPRLARCTCRHPQTMGVLLAAGRLLSAGPLSPGGPPLPCLSSSAHCRQAGARTVQAWASPGLPARALAERAASQVRGPGKGANGWV